ncbi:MAG: L-threonylcarbamoyladenylate synthase [Erysipelotrichaceae bacterium]|nr:L-threonylcarbamoyladenylate synthase [Erysipelotrichaceae bacterium]
MVNRIRRFDPYDTEEMAEILRNEGVISVVTDTVHGVCARMDSLKAQEKLRDIKHRPKDKAFPIMCADLAQIESVAIVSENGRKVINAFMPGPVTVILEKKAEIPDFVNGGMKTLAVRMATSDALEKLIRAVGCPLLMTSANISGQKTCETADEIELACPQLDGIMNGIPKFHEASTIIDCTHESVKILRPGPVSEEMLWQILDENPEQKENE